MMVKELIELLKDCDQLARVTAEWNEKNGNLRLIVHDTVTPFIIKKHHQDILD